MRAARILVFPAILLAACGDSSGGESGDTGTGAGTGVVTGSTTTVTTTTTGEPEPTSSSDPATTEDTTTGSSGGTSSSGGPSSTGEPASEVWIQGFGAGESQRPGGLGFDLDGNLWVAGDLYGDIDLGAGPLQLAGSAIYLARYAPTGEALQVQGFAPASGEATLTQVSGVAVDGSGAVIVTGWLEGTYTLGGSELSADEVDFYVAKWDAGGAPVWGQKFGGVDWQVTYAISAGSDDSLWLAGAALAPFEMGDISLSGAASTGMFVAHLAAHGTPLQGQWWGDSGDQEIRGIAVCDDDSLVIGGYFNDELQFAGEQVATVGDKDMFVAGMDPDGAPAWIRAHGSAGGDYVAQVACDGELAFAGVATGPLKIGELMLDAGADGDIVLGRLAPDGTLDTVATITGPGAQVPTGLAMPADGSTAIAFTSAGPAELGAAKYVAAGERDLVFAHYAPSATTPVQVIGAGDGADQRSGPLAVTDSGYAAIAGSFAGTITWPGLEPVSAAGAEDLVLVRFVPGP